MAKTIPGRLTITAPDEAPRDVTLDRPILRIGRLPEPENDLALVHGLVSRHHAQIYCDREPYRIVDMGSSNGTRVNDIALPGQEVRELRDGDRINIGPFTLTFTAPVHAEAKLQPEAEREASVPPIDSPAEQRLSACPSCGSELWRYVDGSGPDWDKEVFVCDKCGWSR